MHPDSFSHQLYIVVHYFIGTLLRFGQIYFHRYYLAACLNTDYVDLSFAFLSPWGAPRKLPFRYERFRADPFLVPASVSRRCQTSPASEHRVGVVENACLCAGAIRVTGALRQESPGKAIEQERVGTARLKDTGRVHKGVERGHQSDKGGHATPVVE